MSKFTILLLIIFISAAIVSAQNTASNSNNRRRQKLSIKQALDMAESMQLKECLARSACELACDHVPFGKEGRNLHRLMQTLAAKKNIPGVPVTRANFYRKAMEHGKSLKDGKNCKECHTKFSKCSQSTPALLRIASTIDIQF